jgi:hypothetical protein
MTFDRPGAVLTPAQVDILQNFVPWVRGSARAATAMRAALEPSLAERLRTRATELAADYRLPALQREPVREILEIINRQ